MTKIQGEPGAVLERVQALIREVVPNAHCDLEEHCHQICCAAADQFGNVHKINLPSYEWIEEVVRHRAMFLRSRMRTGRSTAG